MHVRSTLCLNPFPVVPGGGKESIRLFFTKATRILNGSLCLCLYLGFLRFHLSCLLCPPTLTLLTLKLLLGDSHSMAPGKCHPGWSVVEHGLDRSGGGRNKQKIMANKSLLLPLPIREGHCLQWLGAWLLKPSSTDSNPDHPLSTWPLLPNMLVFGRGEATRTLPMSLVYEKDHVRSFTGGI